jgi:type IV pilus assembly protein PilB
MQTQINPKIGLTFARALRSMLRHDPDIMMVGEVRDAETAEVAIQTALTGHLVLSTLHTNDASGAVTRLIDMGIEPFMLGSCLILAQAQRLYRKLCTACKKVTTYPADIMTRNHIDPEFFKGAKLYKAAGCPRCSGGFKGRGAVMEVLLVNEAIREAILRGANTTEIRDLAKQHGMISLKDCGLTRVRDGVTSLEAALEVTGAE